MWHCHTVRTPFFIDPLAKVWAYYFRIENLLFHADFIQNENYQSHTQVSMSHSQQQCSNTSMNNVQMNLKMATNRLVQNLISLVKKILSRCVPFCSTCSEFVASANAVLAAATAAALFQLANICTLPMQPQPMIIFQVALFDDSTEW